MPHRRSWITSYRKELEKYNRILHLTSSSADIGRLIEESLYIKDLIPRGAVVLDVGSGGGFPMIPVAAERPDIRAYLVERSSRKATFLNHVKHLLNLENVEVISADYRTIDLPEEVDVITARAVGRNEEIVRHLRKFLKDGGFFLIYGDMSHLDGRGYRVEVLEFPGVRISKIVPQNREA